MSIMRHKGCEIPAYKFARKIIAAGVLAMALAFLPAPASAKTYFNIGIGGYGYDNYGYDGYGYGSRYYGYGNGYYGYGNGYYGYGYRNYHRYRNYDGFRSNRHGNRRGDRHRNRNRHRGRH